jgi:hypothetical protein
MHKTAEADLISSSKLLNLRKYSPVQLQRTPTADDKAVIEEEQSKWFPKLIKTQDDYITEDMASPAKQALLYATAAGLVGAGVGAGVGLAAKPDEKGKFAAVGGLSTAAVAALWAYFDRQIKNANIKDIMLRMPAKAKRRDVELNPVYQMENDTDALRRTAMLNASMRGVYRDNNFTTAFGE